MQKNVTTTLANDTQLATDLLQIIALVFPLSVIALQAMVGASADHDIDIDIEDLATGVALAIRFLSMAGFGSAVLLFDASTSIVMGSAYLLVAAALASVASLGFRFLAALLDQVDESSEPRDDERCRQFDASGHPTISGLRMAVLPTSPTNREKDQRGSHYGLSIQVSRDPHHAFSPIRRHPVDGHCGASRT